MDIEYARVYRELYERHWWWRAREALILKILGSLRAGHGAGRILDVGCGDALFFDQLARFGEVEGVEADESLLSAEGPHRERIHRCAFDASFQPRNRYALILMLDVLEHLPDPEGALRHALSLLDRNGRLVITVPAFQTLWTHHDDLNQHRTRYTRRSFRSVAGLAGARVVELRYFFHWTFPAKLVVRLAERFRGPSGPERLPSAWLNRMLLAISRTEERVLGPLRLPFGSSLLAICAPAVDPLPVHAEKGSVISVP